MQETPANGMAQEMLENASKPTHSLCCTLVPKSFAQSCHALFGLWGIVGHDRNTTYMCRQQRKPCLIRADEPVTRADVEFVSIIDDSDSHISQQASGYKTYLNEWEIDRVESQKKENRVFHYYPPIYTVDDDSTGGLFELLKEQNENEKGDQGGAKDGAFQMSSMNERGACIAGEPNPTLTTTNDRKEVRVKSNPRAKKSDRRTAVRTKKFYTKTIPRKVGRVQASIMEQWGQRQASRYGGGTQASVEVRMGGIDVRLGAGERLNVARVMKGWYLCTGESTEDGAVVVIAEYDSEMRQRKRERHNQRHEHNNNN
ncbi:hypothetical protein DL93DRAFT_2098029 [Clavulina sp. PMI_390]|nr:hypothetical protein DL93DRAFT_2098029 [Clavulina sp. PMI_390]